MSGLRDGRFLISHRRATGRGAAGLRVTWVILVLTSLALLTLSRLDHSYIRSARAAVTDAMAPALELAHGPVTAVRHLAQSFVQSRRMAEELQRLKTENLSLENWKWRARELERQLADLSELARVVREPDIPFVTVRVLASSAGAFSRSVIIDAGRGNKVLAGYAVVSAVGVVGRVVAAHERSSRVLLLTDIASRIPVQIGAARTRAIMQGDGTAAPRLGYLPENAKVEVGEDVLTSGVGGLLPRGLAIGEVVAGPGGFAVKLRASLEHLEHLSVLLHASPELELTDGPGARAAGRRALVAPSGRENATP